MSIQHYENIIKEKRKHTPFREFVMELGSWRSFGLYRAQGMVSRYPADSGRIGKLIKPTDYDPTSIVTGRSTPGGSFFSDFWDLFLASELQSIVHQWAGNENVDFCDEALGAKNAYLSFVTGNTAENILYSAFVYDHVSNVIGSFLVNNNSENIYMSTLVLGSMDVFFSRFIADSSQIWLSSNLTGCHDCILCDDLQNQSYCIRNQPLSREDYLVQKARILQEEKLNFIKIFREKVSKRGINKNSKNSTGNALNFSEDVENGYYMSYLNGGRNVMIGSGGDLSRDMYDAIDVGTSCQDFYAVAWVGWESANIYCSTMVTQSSNIYYSYDVSQSHHCFGCVWLKNRSYCILNEQYEKSEWETRVEAILASMEADGTIGQFFPASLNPFYFNDTFASLIYDDFTKEEVEARGYLWRDEPIRADIPEWLEIVKSTDLGRFQGFRYSPPSRGSERGYTENTPPNLPYKGRNEVTETKTWHIDPSILDKVIVDEAGNYYRIIPIEYTFLMKYGLPLPQLHWLDRIKMGFRA
jgi:hypothetical protein